MRILVLDTQPDRGDQLRSSLDELGKTARWVRDPLFAVTLLHSSEYDTIAVAADLEGTLQTSPVCDLLRSDPDLDDISIVVFDTSTTLNATKPEAADALLQEGRSVPRLARALVEETSRLGADQTPRSRSGPASVLHGTLELFEPADLIQMICRPERSFRLTIHFDLGDALLTVARGRLVHAELNHLCGETAVKRLLALGAEVPSTRFTLVEIDHHVADSTPPTIDIGVPELLLRSSVALDEDRRTPGAQQHT